MLHSIREVTHGQGGNLYAAYATAVALPTVYTATALNGLILYNGSNLGGGKGVTLFLVAASLVLTVAATTVAVSAGISTGTQSPNAQPSTQTAITKTGNLRAGQSNPGPALPVATPMIAGTVTNAAAMYLPIWQVHTGAITVDTVSGDPTVHLGGNIEVPPGSWAAFALSATLTTGTFDLGLVWLEKVND